MTTSSYIEVKESVNFTTVTKLQLNSERRFFFFFFFFFPKRASLHLLYVGCEAQPNTFLEKIKQTKYGEKKERFYLFLFFSLKRLAKATVCFKRKGQRS